MESFEPPSVLFDTEFLQFGSISDGAQCLVRLSLRLSVAQCPTKHVFCEVQFTGADDFIMSHWYGIYAHDVATFLTELGELYVSFEGKAELRGKFDSIPRIVVSAMGEEGGELEVSGELCSGVQLSNMGCVSENPLSGILVRFGGFRVDHSFIPRWTGSIRTMFREGDVDESPYY